MAIKLTIYGLDWPKLVAKMSRILHHDNCESRETVSHAGKPSTDQKSVVSLPSIEDLIRLTTFPTLHIDPQNPQRLTCTK